MFQEREQVSSLKLTDFWWIWLLAGVIVRNFAETVELERKIILYPDLDYGNGDCCNSGYY